MDRDVLTLTPATVRLRRVGRLARRRMRIDGDALRNGVHTDGQLTVEITGLGTSAAGVQETFDWTADRPIALVIVRSGIGGEDVSFHVGPMSAGTGASIGVGDGTGIRYVAFCYDAEVERRGATATVAVAAAPAPTPVAAAPPVPAPIHHARPGVRGRDRVRQAHPQRLARLTIPPAPSAPPRSLSHIAAIDRIGQCGPRAGGRIPLISRSRMTRPR